MSYEYRVFSKGVNALSGDLEGFGEKLNQMLNDESVRALTDSGWELWRIEKFDGYQSNKGFLVILRRPLR